MHLAAPAASTGARSRSKESERWGSVSEQAASLNSRPRTSSILFYSEQGVGARSTEHGVGARPVGADRLARGAMREAGRRGNAVRNSVRDSEQVALEHLDLGGHGQWCMTWCMTWCGWSMLACGHPSACHQPTGQRQHARSDVVCTTTVPALCPPCASCPPALLIGADPRFMRSQQFSCPCRAIQHAPSAPPCGATPAAPSSSAESGSSTGSAAPVAPVASADPAKSSPRMNVPEAGALSNRPAKPRPEKPDDAIAGALRDCCATVPSVASSRSVGCAHVGWAHVLASVSSSRKRRGVVGGRRPITVMGGSVSAQGAVNTCCYMSGGYKPGGPSQQLNSPCVASQYTHAVHATT
jgi:hypothetical protein